MNTAVIGLGSNIQPSKNIRLARQKIDKHHKIIQESRFVQTTPIGYLNQPDFINGVIFIETTMNKDELDKWLKSVEYSQGRQQHPNKYGPRTIDLDILVWNKKIVDKDVYLRAFLKESILEVCPEIDIP